MKKILKYTAFAAMVGLFSSCSDSFFEAESGDIITSDQMDEVDPVAGLILKYPLFILHIRNGIKLRRRIENRFIRNEQSNIMLLRF